MRNRRRTTYRQQDKASYLVICRRYNAACKRIMQDKVGYMSACLELHAAKGTVPQRWRTKGFVEGCGV